MSDMSYTILMYFLSWLIGLIWLIAFLKTLGYLSDLFFKERLGK